MSDKQDELAAAIAVVRKFSKLLKVSECRSSDNDEVLAEAIERVCLAAEQAQARVDGKTAQEWKSHHYALEQENAELRAELATAQAELESHSWEISPAMAQAKIDELNRQLAHAKSQALRDFGKHIVTLTPDLSLAEVADEANDEADRIEREQGKP